jgi:N-acetylmuramoyl-L-alanine amidase
VWAVFLGAILSVLALPLLAQELRAVARIDPITSSVSGTTDDLRLTLGLSQPVPYRIEARRDPDRIVIEFREVDFSGAEPGKYLSSAALRGVIAGPARPGWSRLELLLSAPMGLETAEMQTDATLGSALLEVTLGARSREEFDAAAITGDLGVAAPEPPDVPELATGPERQRGDRPLVIMLDPGHGGFDPGAERDGHSEADLMLTFARELQELIIRESGHTVLLTRNADEFVPLPERVRMAREAAADLFISLHADSLLSGRASGATVYTLSDVASSEASAKLAERMDRASLLAGLDLTAQDDTLATALMDVARLEVAPRAARLADTLVTGLGETVGDLHKRPRQFADFSVLRAPDIPSVLVELGFLSSDNDLARLLSPEWRANAAEGIRRGIDAWAVADAAEADLVRQ